MAAALCALGVQNVDAGVPESYFERNVARDMSVSGHLSSVSLRVLFSKSQDFYSSLRLFKRCSTSCTQDLCQLSVPRIHRLSAQTPLLSCLLLLSHHVACWNDACGRYNG